MEDKLQEKLEQELKQFKQEVKEMGVDVALENLLRKYIVKEKLIKNFQITYH